MQRVAGRYVATTLRRGVKSQQLQLRCASQRQLDRAAKSPNAARYQPPSKPAPTQESIARARQIPLILTLILGGGIGFYVIQLVVAARKTCPNPAITDLAGQKDVSDRYEYTADSFDSEVGFSEMLMGVNKLRRRLAKQCKGHVLEVSCGTGRNLGFFDIYPGGQVDSLTFVDLSPQMVEVCKKKWDVLFGKKLDKLKKGLIVRFLPGSALGAMPLAPTTPIPRKYDTIFQTMGLCSTPTPVAMLQNMVQYLDTDNPEARVFLLEHGRSYQQWLNNILDNSAEKHAEIHGCWFNRDIGELVEEAADKAGLEIVNERRHHLGTTWVFELKPKPKASPADFPSDSNNEQNLPKNSWFRGWFGSDT